MTKPEKAFYYSRLYRKSEAYTLHDAYGRYSHEKQQAWDRCRIMVYEAHGYGLKVLTANTFQFTAAFLVDDEEEGATKLVRITKAHIEVYDYIE